MRIKLRYLSSVVKTNAAHDPKWITPDQQLERFAALTPEFRAIDALEIPQLHNVTGIVVSYLLEGAFINWYIKLKKLNKLPKKMSPASAEMVQFLASPASKRICAKQKPDGSAYTIAETCAVSLALREFGTVNEMEATFTAYGEKHYPTNQNPLKFRLFFYKAREDHGDTSPEPTHWLVQTKTVLENSRNKKTKDQEDLVAELAKETGQDWQFPQLRGSTLTIFSSRVASEEILYEEATAANGDLATYTRVKEKTQGYHAQAYNLLVGGSSGHRAEGDSTLDYGAYVHNIDDQPNVKFGVGAQQKFFLSTCDLDA
jgi:hypothetical protein